MDLHGRSFVLETERQLIEQTDRIEPQDWPEAEKSLVAIDKNISRMLDLSRECHYGYKYNLFTAVRSH